MIGCVLTGHFYEFTLFSILLLIHEMGHICAGIYYHWHIKEIIILPFGGLTKFEDILNKPMKEEWWVTIMGPIFQIIGYHLLKGKIGDELFSFYHYALLFFNLLPIVPLDGSKIIHLIFQYFVSFYKSYQLLIFSSFVFTTLILSVVGIYTKSIFFVMTFLLLYKQIYKMYKEYRYYFRKFLLERYLYKIEFRKRYTIYGDSIKKMKRDHKHLFYIGNNYITERQILKKMFDKKRTL